MPKHLWLFGKYLRDVGKAQQKAFNKRQLTKIIPVKAYGRPPSAASQTGLYHDEDFNYYSKLSFGLQSVRKKLKPMVYRKDFDSVALNTKIENLRVTTSALHAMDDVGGFDEYLLRTPPEEMRSHLGEKMKNVAYFYIEHPEIRNWGLPWKIFSHVKSQMDPYYARYKHYVGKCRSDEAMQREASSYSPYYLPPSHELYPERQAFSEGATELQQMNLWWKKSPEIETAFRRRLGEAKGFERRHADHRMADGYRKGEGRGGGGQHGSTLRKRGKTYKYHQIRHY